MLQEKLTARHYNRIKREKSVNNNQLFPVTVVGSWPRPSSLLNALRKRQAGEISFEEFNKTADDAVLEAIKHQEEAGVDIVSDGEQRRDNFYSFVTEKLDGVKLMTMSQLLDHMKDRASFEETLRALDVPAFAMKSPVATSKVQRRQNLALDELEFLKKHTKMQTKIPLPGPYMLTRSSWFPDLSDSTYPSIEDLGREMTSILREEIIALKQNGADFIQLDEPVLSQIVYGSEGAETFMCAALASRRDPTEELKYALELVNRTLQGISGVKIGVHVCRGNWSRKEDVLLKGNYGPLLPYLMEMKVDQLVLEFATPRAGELEVFKEYDEEKEIGLGVVNPRSSEIESPETIVSKVREATKYFEPSQIYLNPDCGFGTFAERPVNDAQTASSKLHAIAVAAQKLRKEYGDGGRS
ncbi:MAG: cobalamin-independent methionine synthase II family protein [Thaumarchaeota archaeon]|nr:cobalamin-independent methionine synthase II family protein [Nitrososphaerota archaeon]